MLQSSLPLLELLILTTLSAHSVSMPLNTPHLNLLPRSSLPSLTLTKRYVPPSTYIHAARLSTKAIILLTIFIFVTLFACTLTCYCCIKRRRSKARARRRELQQTQSRTLKPRITKRNARFFAPGLVMDKLERDRLRQERETEKAWNWNQKEEEYEMWKLGGGVGVEEVKMPEKTKGGWREVMRGVVKK